MNQEEFNSMIRKSLCNKPPCTPKFCNICGSYSSYKHQGVWCSKHAPNGCSGKYIEFPDMTWADCLLKAKRQGAGWMNSFFDHIVGWEDKRLFQLWKNMGANLQVYKWCEEFDL